MKVWIDDECFDTSLDWTFREEKAVYRLAELRPGDFWSELFAGSTVPVLAAAIVGWMRAKPGQDPDFLVDAKSVRGDGFQLDEGATVRLKLDFSDEEEDEAGPPAEGGARRRPAAKSPRSS